MKTIRWFWGKKGKQKKLLRQGLGVFCWVFYCCTEQSQLLAILSFKLLSFGAGPTTHRACICVLLWKKNVYADLHRACHSSSQAVTGPLLKQLILSSLWWCHSHGWTTKVSHKPTHGPYGNIPTVAVALPWLTFTISPRLEFKKTGGGEWSVVR